MKLFVDTSGLFAAMDRDDLHHPDARELLTYLIREKEELHTTSYVLQETLSLLQSRISLPAAVEFGEALQPLLSIAWVTDVLHQRAFQRLVTKHRRKLSLVDCASFVAMEEAGLTAVFGYDAHFSQEGFQLIKKVSDLLR